MASGADLRWPAIDAQETIKMRSYKAWWTTSLLTLALGVAGCFRAPLELKTALDKQAVELDQINTAYQTNINALLDAIEKLQIEILDDTEARLLLTYAHDGKIGEPVTAASNPDLLVVRMKTEKKLRDFFRSKREAVHANIAAKRSEFMKLQQNIDNARQVNKALQDYTDSLIKLKKVQDEFASHLIQKLGVLPTSVPVATNVINEVIRVTNQELDQIDK